MLEPRELSIGAAINLMRTGDLTAQELLKSCLERIHEREEDIHAWVDVYGTEALEDARRCDNESRMGQWRGELHGIPVGVKDIIHVKGMWTRAGTPIYPAHVADRDAHVIQRLRAAGAIILGKTETTPFANADPTITCNPWNQEYTPGGSSSGSAAAVADRMCLAALGTQTGGSLLRPAAYNGIVGFKPTYGRISLDGVVPNAYSMDTIGVLTRCVGDVKILLRHMLDDHPLPFGRIPMATKALEKPTPGSLPRLGHIEEFFEKKATPEVVENLAFVREKFERAGAIIVELKLPDSFSYVANGWDIIKQTELASYHGLFFDSHRDQYPPIIKAKIEKGLMIPGHKYVEALQQRIAFQRAMSERLSQVDAAFMPTAYSTAPKGLASTGSGVFNKPWSFSGFPAMSIPSGADDNGLPFAVQLVAQPMAEGSLLKAASWCESVLDFKLSPATKSPP